MSRGFGEGLLVHCSSMAAHFFTISPYGCDLCLGPGPNRDCSPSVCAQRVREQLQGQLLGIYKEGTRSSSPAVWIEEGPCATQDIKKNGPLMGGGCGGLP